MTFERIDLKNMTLYYKLGLCSLKKYNELYLQQNICWKKEDLYYLFKALVNFVHYFNEKKKLVKNFNYFNFKKSEQLKLNYYKQRMIQNLNLVLKVSIKI